MRDWIIATVASKGKDRSLELLTVLSSLCLKCTTLNITNVTLRFEISLLKEQENQRTAKG